MSLVKALAAIAAIPCVLGSDGHAQARTPLAGAVVSSVGVVRDVEKSAAAYAEVFGVTVTRPVTTTIDLADRGRARLKIATVPLAGLRVDLIQPLGGRSPYSAFLGKYGEGIQHVGLVVS